MRPASSGGQPQRGSPTSTSTSTSRIPFAAAALDRLGGVDRDGDPGAAVGHRPQPVGVHGLVGEEQVVAEPGRGHADDLARRRGAERRGARARPGGGRAPSSCAPSRAAGSRSPGSAAAIVARLCSNAAPSTTSAGVGRSWIFTGAAPVRGPGRATRMAHRAACGERGSHLREHGTEMNVRADEERTGERRRHGPRVGTPIPWGTDDERYFDGGAWARSVRRARRARHAARVDYAADPAGRPRRATPTAIAGRVPPPAAPPAPPPAGARRPVRRRAGTRTLGRRRRCATGTAAQWTGHVSRHARWPGPALRLAEERTAARWATARPRVGRPRARGRRRSPARSSGTGSPTTGTRSPTPGSTVDSSGNSGAAVARSARRRRRCSSSACCS